MQINPYSKRPRNQHHGEASIPFVMLQPLLLPQQQTLLQTAAELGTMKVQQSQKKSFAATCVSTNTCTDTDQQFISPAYA